MSGVEAVVEIRPGREADLPALTEIYNHYVMTTVATFDLEPFTVDERREWLSHYAETGRHRLLVAVSDDEIVGYATSSRFRDKAAYDTSIEVTVYLRPGVVAQGIGSALYAGLLECLRGEDVHRAYAAIALPNDASVALHRRFGFVEVGVLTEVGHKLGEWRDVLWMQRPLP